MITAVSERWPLCLWPSSYRNPLTLMEICWVPGVMCYIQRDKGLDWFPSPNPSPGELTHKPGKFFGSLIQRPHSIFLNFSQVQLLSPGHILIVFKDPCTISYRQNVGFYDAYWDGESFVFLKNYFFELMKAFRSEKISSSIFFMNTIFILIDISIC